MAHYIIVTYLGDSTYLDIINKGLPVYEELHTKLSLPIQRSFFLFTCHLLISPVVYSSMSRAALQYKLFGSTDQHELWTRNQFVTHKPKA